MIYYKEGAATIFFTEIKEMTSCMETEETIYFMVMMGTTFFTVEEAQINYMEVMETII